ncbi:MAG: hypothetical protein IJ848_00370 [Alphaproteobacteria bacterium]|nr:hypothetical protein [Alphaproteobacteria bacterium]
MNKELKILFTVLCLSTSNYSNASSNINSCNLDPIQNVVNLLDRIDMRLRNIELVTETHNNKKYYKENNEQFYRNFDAAEINVKSLILLIEDYKKYNTEYQKAIDLEYQKYQQAITQVNEKYNDKLTKATNEINQLKHKLNTNIQSLLKSCDAMPAKIKEYCTILLTEVANCLYMIN